MTNHSPKPFGKPKTGFIIDVGVDVVKQRIVQHAEAKAAVADKEQALLSNELVRPGMPATTGINPPGYQAPEAAKAKQEVLDEDVDVQQILRPPKIKSKSSKGKYAAADAKRKQLISIKVEQDLERSDWDAVASFYQHTSKLTTIATQTGLSTTQVNHLLLHGIVRLGLPGIKDYTIKQGQLILDVNKQKKEQTQLLYSADVAAAIQGRATQEAAAAKSMLQQSIQTGNIVGGYVQALFERLKSGDALLAIPANVTLDTLDGMTKIVDAHTRSMERAIKMVRLTQGEPTERVEHQIGAMLAVCTTKELEDAAASGNLPRRLTSRISGSDPVQEQSSNDIPGQPQQSTGISAGESIHPTAAPIDEANKPAWLNEIAPAEGLSSSAVDGSDSDSGDT